MKCSVTRNIFIFFTFISLLSGCIYKKSYDINWRNYENGLEEAEKENKPLLIFFYIQNCMSCELFEKYILSNKSVVKKLKKFVCVKVDGQVDNELVEKYHINTFPTVLFIKTNGEISRVEGYDGDTKKFLAKLDSILGFSK